MTAENLSNICMSVHIANWIIDIDCESNNETIITYDKKEWSHIIYAIPIFDTHIYFALN